MKFALEITWRRKKVPEWGYPKDRWTGGQAGVNPSANQQVESTRTPTLAPGRKYDRTKDELGNPEREREKERVIDTQITLQCTLKR